MRPPVDPHLTLDAQASEREAAPRISAAERSSRSRSPRRDRHARAPRRLPSFVGAPESEEHEGASTTRWQRSSTSSPRRRGGGPRSGRRAARGKRQGQRCLYPPVPRRARRTTRASMLGADNLRPLRHPVRRVGHQRRVIGSVHRETGGVARPLAIGGARIRPAAADGRDPTPGLDDPAIERVGSRVTARERRSEALSVEAGRPHDGRPRPPDSRRRRARAPAKRDETPPAPRCRRFAQRGNIGSAHTFG
jgi:hypothetical protein